MEKWFCAVDGRLLFRYHEVPSRVRWLMAISATPLSLGLGRGICVIFRYPAVFCTISSFLTLSLGTAKLSLIGHELNNRV
jgi:hypothetical protein